MTTMEKPQKPQSNKAKTFNRYSGKQDRGTAAGRKGHENLGFWEDKWKMRGAINTDKTYLKEVIRDGLAASEYTKDDELALKQDAEDKAQMEVWAEHSDDFDYDESDFSDGDFDDEDDMGHDEDANSELLNQNDHSEAAFGVPGKREVRKIKEREAELDDDYRHDDFGDYNDSHIRISNRPR